MSGKDVAIFEVGRDGNSRHHIEVFPHHYGVVLGRSNEKIRWVGARALCCKVRTFHMYAYYFGAFGATIAILADIVDSLVDIGHTCRHRGRTKRRRSRIEVVASDSVDSLNGIFHTVLAPTAVGVDIYVTGYAVGALTVNELS